MLDGREKGLAALEAELLLLEEAPNVKPVVVGREEEEVEDERVEAEEDTPPPPNVNGETEVDGVEVVVEAENAGAAAPKEKVELAGANGVDDDDAPPNVNGDDAVVPDELVEAANDGVVSADEDVAAPPKVKGCNVGAVVFLSVSFCLVSVVVLFVLLLPNVNCVSDEEDVDSNEEEEEDVGVKLNGVKVDDGAPNEKVVLEGAAAVLVSSSSSAAPPPPALSSSHEV